MTLSFRIRVGSESNARCESETMAKGVGRKEGHSFGALTQKEGSFQITAIRGLLFEIIDLRTIL